MNHRDHLDRGMLQLSRYGEKFPIVGCRSCNASIVWAKTFKGKLMPVDVHPSPDGNVLLYEETGLLRAEVQKGDDAKLKWVDYRRSHFATCPAADQWRRG